jgi:PAS domain S-box-containing protein
MLESQAISQAINRQPLVVHSDASIWQVIEKFRQACASNKQNPGFTSGFALVERDGQLKGYFAAQNIPAVLSLQSSWQQIPIAEVMKTPVMVLQESELSNHFELLDLFSQAKIDFLPIVDAQAGIVGTLSERDLLRLVARQADRPNTQSRSPASASSSNVSVQVGIWDWHIESGEIFIDPILKNLLGYTDQGIPNTIDQWAQHVHPEDLQRVMDAANSCLTGESPSYEIEHRMVHQDGSTVWFLARGQVIWDQNQKPLRMIGTDTNITSSKFAEEKINLQANILAHISDAVVVTDNQHVITYWNPAAVEMYGFSAQEVIGQKISTVLNYEWPSSSHKRAAFSELITNGSWLGELIHSCRDGQRLLVESSTSVVMNRSGDRIGFLSITRNISDRKQAEQELKQAKEQLQAVIDAVPGFVSWIDNDCKYIGVNRRLADTLNLPPTDIIGQKVGFSGHRSQFQLFIDQFLLDQNATTSQIIDTDFNGKRYNYLVAAQKYNQNQAIVSVGIDITETQKSQAALRSLVAGTATVTGAEFFSVLVQYLASALEVKCAIVSQLEGERCKTVAMWCNGRLSENIDYDPSNTPCELAIKKGVYYCCDRVGVKFPPLHQMPGSESFESYFGLRLENSAREPIGILCVLDDRPLANEKIARYILSIFAARAAAELERRQVELALQQAKSELELRVEMRTQDLRMANDELRAEMAQKELVKLALANSEEKFRHIFEDAPIGISLVDLNAHYIQANSRLCQLLGYTATELRGKTLQNVTHPDDLPKELPYLERIILGEIDSYNLEQRYLRKDGSSWWANLIVTVVRDDVGAILYTLGMVKDISDRKRSEQALFQSEERFRKIFESGPLGMAIIGFNQRIMKVNTMLCEMLDYDEDSMTEFTLREIT